MLSVLPSEWDKVLQSPSVKGKLMLDIWHQYKCRAITVYLLLPFKRAPDQLPTSMKFKLLSTNRNPSILRKEKNSYDLLCKAFILILHQKKAWNGNESKRLPIYAMAVDAIGHEIMQAQNCAHLTLCTREWDVKSR